MRPKSVFTMAVAAIALTAGGAVRAGHDFTVTAIPDPTYFTGTSGTSILDSGLTGTTTLVAGPNVTYPANGVLSADLTGIDVNFAHPSVTSNLTMPETVNFNYGYDVTVHDMITGQSGTALVTGTIGGTASATGSNLTATGFAVNPSLLDLGGDLFKLSASTTSGTGTSPNVGSEPGSLVIHVADPIPGPPSAVPEPASIALLGLGGLGLLGMLRRRRMPRA